jgi:hypothetical protein
MKTFACYLSAVSSAFWFWVGMFCGVHYGGPWNRSTGLWSRDFLSGYGWPIKIMLFVVLYVVLRVVSRWIEWAEKDKIREEFERAQ